ncbi:hypothetical protein [Metallibacterium scheffleri]|uniref:Uncharacterized protein n=1 Tax=Metallibacterium scheffleri TaxID=993689 RepID=A0A4S3KGQ5_9GAMM|nr:hypothetical protein [Metallibacterium scheffleri]THD07776.1 hypothetical protein B1806_14565 [Metallibacterium scheffleri]
MTTLGRQNEIAPDAADRVAQVKSLLVTTGADRDVVRAAIHALSDDELMPFGLGAFRMNIMSLFSDDWSRQHVLQVARDATISYMWTGWEYHNHYLPKLGPEADTPQIDDMPFGRIRQLLGDGRGLVLASFHLGHFRYMLSDIAHAGIECWVPLATSGFNDYASAREANPDAAFWCHLHTVNAELQGKSTALARALARGGCVLSTIDGNTGIDGPRGNVRRATVRLLGTDVRVKDGLIRMAARFGAPILPLIAYSEGDRRRCRVGDLINPDGPLAGDVADRFVREALQQAYAFFADALTDFAAEWCGASQFHQWRVPCHSEPQPMEDVAQQLARHLESGGRLFVNVSRIVELSRGEEIVWTDVKTQRCYRMPAAMKALVERLSPDRDGVDRAWLDDQVEPARSRMWDLVCQLGARNAICGRES